MQKYVHKILRGQSQPRKTVDKLTDWLDMTVTVLTGP